MVNGCQCYKERKLKFQKRWDFACDPDESSERSGGWTLTWRSVQPNPEVKLWLRSLCLDGWQQLVDDSRSFLVINRRQGPSALPAAAPSLPERLLLEEDSVTSFLVTDSIALHKRNFLCWLLPLCFPQPLSSASRSQTDRQQPQHAQNTHPAATAAASDDCLHPPRHEV